MTGLMGDRTWWRVSLGVGLLAMLWLGCGSDEDDGTGGGATTATGTGTGTGSPTGTTGGECEYVDVPGQCIITAVADAPNNDAADQISFTFDADDPTLLDGSWYTYDPSEVHLGTLSPKSCTTDHGLTVSSSHDCVLSVSVSGTCTPMMIALSELGADCHWSN